MVLEKSVKNGCNFLNESWYLNSQLPRQRAKYFLSFLAQNSMNLVDNSEIETLRKECEVATKKCKEAQEKYFSESDRLKAIIDEQEGMFGCPKWAVGFTRLVSLAAVFCLVTQRWGALRDDTRTAAEETITRPFQEDMSPLKSLHGSLFSLLLTFYGTILLLWLLFIYLFFVCLFVCKYL